MTTLVHSFCSRHVLCIDHNKFETIGDLKTYLYETKGLQKDASFFICNGNLVEDSDPVQKDVVYHTYPRILGGKGGFGSMLRAIGAQIEKTTNHEALRDLSGRRMRDVNNEKALKEWLAKQTDKEAEREQRRQERLARRRAMPQHKFDDPLYHQQKSQLAESQEQALYEGLKKSQTVPGTSSESECKKRKCEDPLPGSSKQRKTTEWLGIDMDKLSDLDSDEDENSVSTSNSVISGSEGANNPDSTSQGRNSASENNDICTDDVVTQKSETTSDSERAGTDSSEHINEQISEAGEKVNGNVEDQQKSEGITAVPQNGCTKDAVEKKQKERMNEHKEKSMAGPIDLDSITTATELLEYGLDPLKQELMNRGLKCGGTLEQRAERLFSVKGLKQEEIEPSLFAKNGGKNLKKKSQ